MLSQQANCLIRSVSVYPEDSYVRPHQNVRASAEFEFALSNIYGAINSQFNTVPPVMLSILSNTLLIDNVLLAIQDDVPAIVYETYRSNDRAQTPFSYMTTLRIPDRVFNESPATYCYVGSVGYFNYGHWLIDDLPRAVIAREKIVGPIRWVIPSSTPAVDEAKRASLAALTGTNPEIVFIGAGELIRFERLVYVSPVSYHPYQKSPASLRALQRRFDTGSPIGQGKKIFVSRSQTDSRGLLNMPEVRTILAESGYQQIDPGSMSFEAQRATFSNALAVVGVMGAAMTNTLFCPPGTPVVYLAPEGWLEPFYWDLAAVIGHKYACIYGARPQRAGNADTEPPHLGQFRVDIAELLQFLPQF